MILFSSQSLIRRVVFSVGCVMLLAGCMEKNASDKAAEATQQTVKESAAVTKPEPAPKKPTTPAKPKKEKASEPKKKKPPPKRVIMGWVERVTLLGSNHTVKAKLDSGAKTSSVDAEIIKTFKRDGKRYALYRVILDDEITETYESRIVRMVRIKKKEGGFIRRPVVKMRFCLGGKTIRSEVSLAERGHFIYPVLIGRNMLEKANILVDTSQTHTAKPSCKK